MRCRAWEDVCGKVLGPSSSHINVIAFRSGSCLQRSLHDHGVSKVVAEGMSINFLVLGGFGDQLKGRARATSLQDVRAGRGDTHLVQTITSGRSSLRECVFSHFFDFSRLMVHCSRCSAQPSLCHSWTFSPYFCNRWRPYWDHVDGLSTIGVILETAHQKTVASYSSSCSKSHMWSVRNG